MKLNQLTVICETKRNKMKICNLRNGNMLMICKIENANYRFLFCKLLAYFHFAFAKWKYTNNLKNLRGELCEISITFANNSMRRSGHKAQK